MIKRAALHLIWLSAAAIAVAYASAFPTAGEVPGWANWLLVFGTAGSLTGAMVLGAVRNDRIGRLAIAFAAVFLILAGGFGAALLLPAADPADPTLWLGLPPRAAIVMYGVGLLPYLIAPVAYAFTFERQTLSGADLERVRAAARALRVSAGAQALREKGRPAPATAAPAGEAS